MSITTPDKLTDEIIARANDVDRLIVAIAGAPGSGKSTLSGELNAAINSRQADSCCVVPMDGFHLDNAILDARNLRHRKGAPETFDCPGFEVLLKRLRSERHDTVIPVFDRTLDLARAGAEIVRADQRILLVEGNYLLLSEAPWNRLHPLFDMTVFLSTDIEELERRLIQRWLDHGHDAQAAEARARSNDLPNAERVVHASIVADWTIATA